MRNKYYDRAKKGAALLDEHYDGWVNKVKMQDLDMSDRRCVLTQVYGEYTEGRNSLGLDAASSHAHGFTLYDYSTGGRDCRNPEWALLTKAWGRLILRRLGERFRE